MPTDAQFLAMLLSGGQKPIKARKPRKPTLRVGEEVSAWGHRGNVTRIEAGKVWVYFADKDAEAWFRRADVNKVA